MTVSETKIKELAERVRAWAAVGWSSERIVQHLFDAGLSKGDAAIALSRGTGLSRSESIRAVHQAKAYEARKTADESWNAALCDVLEDDEFIASLESASEDDTAQ